MVYISVPASVGVCTSELGLRGGSLEEYSDFFIGVEICSSDFKSEESKNLWFSGCSRLLEGVAGVVSQLLVVVCGEMGGFW